MSTTGKSRALLLQCARKRLLVTPTPLSSSSSPSSSSSSLALNLPILGRTQPQLGSGYSLLSAPSQTLLNQQQCCSFATVPSLADSTKTTVAPPKRGKGATTTTTTNDTTTTTTTKKERSSYQKKNKKKHVSLSKRMTTSTRKKKQPIKVQFLHLQKELQSRQVIEEAFDNVAKPADPSKFKWISLLETKLSTLDETENETETEAAAAVNSNSNSNNNKTQTQRKQKKNKKTKSLLQQTQYILESRKISPATLKTVFWDLLLADDDNKNDKKKKKKSKPKKHPKQLSKKAYQHDFEIFQKARLAAIESPFFWDLKQKRKAVKAFIATGSRTRGRGVTEQYQEDRVEFLQQIQDSKSQQELDDETHALMSFLLEEMPRVGYNRLVSFFEEFVKASELEEHEDNGDEEESELGDEQDNDDDDDNEEEDDTEDADDEASTSSTKTTTTASSSSLSSTTTPKKKRDKLFFNHIQAHSRKHVHLVAPELADFFYVTTVKQQQQEEENNEDNDNDAAAAATTSPSPSFFVNDPTIVHSDSRIKKSIKSWNDAREKYVDSFLAVQSILLEEYKRNNDTVKGKGVGGEVVEGDDAESDFVLDEHSDDDFSDEDDDDDVEQNIMETFDTAGAVSAKPKKLTIPRHYIVFEAMKVGDWATNIGSGDGSRNTDTAFGQVDTADTPLANFPAVAPTDRLVIIDNLPIDVTQRALMQAYSRCGDIEALQIFHQRTDLDPGRRAVDTRKKIRKPSSQRQRWRRPRTPLYGLIMFRDTESAARAVVDPLRIFGMVLDKHLIRSYRANDMMTLYLEDTPTSQGVTDIEYAVSQLLHPDLYVCLDVGKRQTRAKRVRNCQIKFPNFEAAYWAYLKLNSELEFLNEGDCALHWMETPHDAHLYWTRQLNF